MPQRNAKMESNDITVQPIIVFTFTVDSIYNDVTYHEELIEEMPKTIFGEGFWITCLTWYDRIQFFFQFFWTICNKKGSCNMGNIT